VTAVAESLCFNRFFIKEIAVDLNKIDRVVHAVSRH
jgi:hypothetical protein